ncbi:MAG: hypothetical protein AAGE86_01330 [Pseudomonadota bacterium]
MSDAFSNTWEFCQQSPQLCGSLLAPDGDPETIAEALREREENWRERQNLVQAIQLRADAVRALERAYDALGREADYDASGDLQGAVGDALDAVNEYSQFVMPPGSSIVSGTAGEVAGLVAGIFAERKQKKRLIQGSQAIRLATTQLRDALRAEAATHKIVLQYTVNSRTNARIALYQAGLVSRAQFLEPLTDELDLNLLNNADRILDGSRAAQVAVEDIIRAQEQSQVFGVQSRYDASVGALGALIDAHSNFENGQPVSIRSVSRFLAELDAAIAASSDK